MDSTSASSNMWTVNTTSAPIIVADDQGTAEVPATPVMHTNPYEVAKDIRRKTRELLQRVLEYAQPQQPGNLINARQNVGYAGSYSSDTQDHLDRMVQHFVTLDHRLSEMRAAYMSRRVSVGHVAYQNLVRSSSDMQQTHQRVHARLRRTREYIDSANALLKQAAAQPVSDVPATQQERIKKLCDELHVLAQALPTFPNSPMAPADNVLRAMATLLKNGGYLESSSEYVKVIAPDAPEIIDESGDDEYNDEDNGEDE